MKPIYFFILEQFKELKIFHLRLFSHNHESCLRCYLQYAECKSIPNRLGVFSISSSYQLFGSQDVCFVYPVPDSYHSLLN